MTTSASASMTAKKDYLEYLENVLGVKSILSDTLSVPLVTKTDLLICVQDYKTYTAPELDLLQKMISALKVDASRFLVVDLAMGPSIEKTACVFFKDELSAYPFDSELTVQTYSPRVLLLNPELKKAAWTELQKVLQFFASRPTEV